MRSYSGPISDYSAKLLSPFRYPGGKTWLVPLICQRLHNMESKPVEFIEPFAGGSIVGLNVAFRGLAEHVTLVELDEDVAAVWETIINGNARSLADRIVAFNLTLDSVAEELSKSPTDLEDRAFQIILRNRISRGGILAPGAGILRQGENGRGIKSRWYPETLRKRILQVAEMRERITFIHGDGLDVLRENAQRADVVFFIDPPYTVGDKKPGRRLYTHYEIDHDELFRVASMLTGNFLMTYSNDERVRRLALRYNFDVREITMRNNHHIKKTELLIGRNLRE
ncbi:MAG: DNA adenine methylase [Chloroflexi bacterium]|nr:MAG: DNA adenine methylase [Chloroflexota bacterium]RLC83514.1 MAG: DNA adenine methylase [Chloroflexota bacterium]